MKIEVNGNYYDVEISEDKALVNGEEVDVNLNEEEEGGGEVEDIIIKGKKFSLDFMEEGEPALMIINGMTYLVSKSTLEDNNTLLKEIKAPISGRISDIFVRNGSEVKRGQPLLILEAMKMENQIKSPTQGKVKEITIRKDQTVKIGEVMLIFE
jgi:biotin carboxyl carrier protein